jgi:hypothetical protein
MTVRTALLLALLSSPAHAESTWCVLTSNGVCNITPTIIRCDYESPNRNPRCVGVGPADGVISTAAEQKPHRKAPR